MLHLDSHLVGHSFIYACVAELVNTWLQCCSSWYCLFCNHLSQILILFRGMSACLSIAYPRSTKCQSCNSFNVCVCEAAAVSAAYCLWKIDRLYTAFGQHQISNVHLVPVVASRLAISSLGSKITGVFILMHSCLKLTEQRGWNSWGWLTEKNKTSRQACSIRTT